jgi:hypothetical protein
VSATRTDCRSDGRGAVLPTIVFGAALLAAGGLAATPVGAQVATGMPGAVSAAPLPPALPWDGRSRRYALGPDDAWVTPTERSGFRHTPSYQATVDWLGRLAAHSPDLDLVSIGRSAQGRDIWMVVAARGVEATPGALIASGRPTLLVHGGIHAGEIDGKDAGMMLLRDLTVNPRHPRLLDRVNLLFVPVLNVDGHERASRYSRMNQRGPEVPGWRTNARNLNLNRDFTKLETEGVRALVEVMNGWQPDLYLDIHVTDGADYQYDITYGFNGPHAWSPATAGWLRDVYSPAIDDWLRSDGHVPGPLLLDVDGGDLRTGVVEWTASPRYSHAYGDARHLASILVENHSLKPFEQRVLGTYSLLLGTMRLLGEQFDGLRRASRADATASASEVPLAFEPGPAYASDLLGVSHDYQASPVTGRPTLRWTGRPQDIDARITPMSQVSASVRRPASYFIPREWAPVAEKLRAHGIVVSTVASPTRVRVERYRLPEAGAASEGTGGGEGWFEGRMRIDSGQVLAEPEELELQPGDFVVQTDQRLGTLAVLLLEPASPDSLFQWGYMMEILQRTEYFEEYVMEPLAQQMLAEDPELADAFEAQLLRDEAFAGSARDRLEWFYRRTAYFDPQYRRYPIVRSLH